MHFDFVASNRRMSNSVHLESLFFERALKHKTISSFADFWRKWLRMMVSRSALRIVLLLHCNLLRMFRGVSKMHACAHVSKIEEFDGSNNSDLIPSSTQSNAHCDLLHKGKGDNASVLRGHKATYACKASVPKQRGGYRNLSSCRITNRIVMSSPGLRAQSQHILMAVPSQKCY